MNYIYTLKDPETNQIKYVGKTNNLSKRFNRHISEYNLINENTLKSKWISALKTKGLLPIIEILDECNDDIVDDIEIYWISQMKSWGFRLTNMTDGGDGFKGNNNSQKRSDYSKFLIKINNKTRKDILQFDLNNNFIEYHLSSHDAARKTGFHRQHISGCCKHKKGFTTCHGFYFRYVDDYFPCMSSTLPDMEKINSIITDFKIKRYNPIKRIKKSLKSRKLLKVFEYNKNGDILNKYESVRLASIKTGISIGLISHCCRKKTHFTAKGRIFRYEKDKFDWTWYDNTIHDSNKKICQYSTNGELVKIFTSIKRAAVSISADPSSISRCCKNKTRKTGKFIVVKGFTYRYFSETNGLDLFQ